MTNDKGQEEAIEFLRNLKPKIYWIFPEGKKIDDDKCLRGAIETVLNMLKEKDKEIEKVLELIFQYGQIDGDHHKAWVIDQIVRILTGDKYKEWVQEYTYDEETGECYSWNKGIAP